MYETFLERFADPCQTEGCNAPFNLGCQVVGNTSQCICPSCPFIRSPICATDDVQDLSECHMKQQACLADLNITVAKQGPCGTYIYPFFYLLRFGLTVNHTLSCSGSSVLLLSFFFCLSFTNSFFFLLSFFPFFFHFFLFFSF